MRASLGHGTGSALAIINGPDSWWTNADQFIIGNGGEAVVRIQDQGRLISCDATLGANAGSHGSVSLEGEGSTWEVFQSLVLGKAQNGGSGNVSIAGGGNRLYVGAAAVRNAEQIPTGQSALVVSEEGGVATLEMFGGSQLQNAGKAFVANGDGETGIVTITGAGTHWTNQADASIGAGGPGMLLVSNSGQFTTMGDLTIGSHGALQGNGTVSGNIVNAGTVSPGNAVGVLAIVGNYAQTDSGILHIDLSGAATSEFDSLNVMGAASIDGTLEVSLGQTGGVPYAPQIGDAFNIIATTANLTGQFSSTDLPLLSAGQTWQLSYASGMVTLLVTSAGIAGDYNGNGRLDAADYVVWRNSLVAVSLDADGNGDGTVNIADYEIWRAAYGSFGVSLGGGAMAVPEPTAISVVLSLAISCAVSFRRGWRHQASCL